MTIMLLCIDETMVCDWYSIPEDTNNLIKVLIFYNYFTETLECHSSF